MAEMRSARRLVRTWIFVAAGVILSVTPWVISSINFLSGSGYSPDIALMNNVRYTFASQFTGMLFLVFSIGVVFLAFDIRVRDKVNRMYEVMESRPMDNFGYLLGRSLGIMCIVVIPMIVTMSLATIVALVTQMVGSIQLESAQPHSFWYTVLIDIVPNMFFYTAFVVFLSMVLRYRLLVIVCAVGLMVLQFWLISIAPIHLLEVLNWVTSQNLPSDIDTFFTSAWILFERLLLISLGLGLLYLGAIAHQREDGNVFLGRTALGSGLLVLGVLGFGLGLANVQEISDQRKDWVAKHNGIFVEQPTQLLDIDKISGTVRVIPGESLFLDLSIELEVVTNDSSDGLLFSFNPGLEIQSLSVNEQTNIEYEFDRGLLLVGKDERFASGTTVVMHIQATGLPNNQFEHLDSAIDIHDGTMFDVPVLRLLGQNSLVFDTDFVSLPAYGAWYPQPGPMVQRDLTSKYPTDFFSIDVEVETPEGWLVAGPGKRQKVSGRQGNVVRFNPSVKLPSLNLFADEFHRVAMEINGIEFELLVHPKHTKNLPIFVDILPEIEEEIGAILAQADRYGVSYPMTSLSVVEVPTNMRVYGGGWRMDTAQALPGVLLTKELAFPTANFSRPTSFENRSEWDEERRKEYKLALLRSFIKNDLYGGNLFLGFARNLFAFQTSATGDGSEALNVLLEKLIDQLIINDQGFFTTYLLTSPVGATPGMGFRFGDSEMPEVLTNRFRNWIFSRASNWEASLVHPLSDLPFDDDPKTSSYVLELKTSKLATMLIKGLDSDDIGALLSTLLERHRGMSFTPEDYQGIANELNIPMNDILGDWLHSTTLPGFLASNATVVRLRDDENQFPRYQTSFYLRNNEEAPGVVVLEYEVDDVNMTSEAVVVQGNTALRFNLITNSPPEDLEVESYLSLNRKDLEIFMAEREDDQRIPQVDEDPRPFFELSDWDVDEGDSIIVDDLDPGFSAESDLAAIEFPGPLQFFSFLQPELQLDQGLPISWIPVKGGWMRSDRWGNYGRYRGTRAETRGSGDTPFYAYFTATLPHSGEWNLDYYLPLGTQRRANRDRGDRVFTTGSAGVTVQLNYGWEVGKINIEVEHGDETIPVDFDASVAADGWNRLGQFELPADSVVVRVSSESTGDVVYADAIRWTPANSPVE